jgi:uncharacterized membrane protein
MQTRPTTHNHPWLPLMLLMLVLPVILLLLYFRLATASFRLLGLTPEGASLLLLGSVVGSMINIPLSRRRITLADPRAANLSPAMQWVISTFHYYPPAVVEQVVAVNVGGALIPILFSGYLLTLPTTPVAAAGLATLFVAVVAKLLARPMPGLGITLPSFIPPLLAAGAAIGLVHLFTLSGGAAPIAYIAGSMGTLIGADLLNLPTVLRGGLLAAGPQRLWPARRVDDSPSATQPRILSIGGVGVFDGIFLTGIIAPFLVGMR